MALTDQQYKDLIIDETEDPGGIISKNIDVYWEIESDRGKVSKKLQYLYTFRKALMTLLTRAHKKVDFNSSGDLQVRLQQMSDNLQELYDRTQSEIDELEKQIDSAGGGAVGQLTQTAPVMPPSRSGPDANDRRYRGDPYRRNKRYGNRWH